MAELTPEEIRGLLDGSTLGPWIAVARSGQTLDEGERSGLGFDIEGPPEPMLRGQFANGPDARLIAAAPDLARQLLAAMEENERLRASVTGQDRGAGASTREGEGSDEQARGGAESLPRDPDATSDGAANPAPHLATLEGIVRRLLDGWEFGEFTERQGFPFGWCWFRHQALPDIYEREAASETEALILKEMQQ